MRCERGERGERVRGVYISVDGLQCVCVRDIYLYDPGTVHQVLELPSSSASSYTRLASPVLSCPHLRSHILTYPHIKKTIIQTNKINQSHLISSPQLTSLHPRHRQESIEPIPLRKQTNPTQTNPTSPNLTMPPQPLHRIPLTSNWTFQQSSSLPPSHTNTIASSPLPVSQFPTVAHLDLLHHGLIPDPYVDTNELDCLWVNDADWVYRTTFTLPPLPPASPASVSPSLSALSLSPTTTTSTTTKADLVFEGLDTLVSVYVDGTLVLEGNNMHISYRVPVSHLLSSSSSPDAEHKHKHSLELRFRNAPAHAKAEMQRIGYRGNGTDVHFGGPERLFVRKAQYHWGWDWGPALNTCGPWKPVYVEVYEGRVSEFVVRQEVSADLGSAVVRVWGLVEGGAGTLVLDVRGPDGSEVVKREVSVGEGGVFEAELEVKGPELWWPFTYGAQPLYSVTATLPGLDSQTRKIGLRRLRLLQHPLKSAEGTSFTFEINNTRIFCGGSCWIPGDCLLPRMTPERYRSWLELAKSGNQGDLLLAV